MSEDSVFGRPEKVTKEQVLKAIHDIKSTSASAIAKHLKADRATIYRRFNGDPKKGITPITDEEISEALGISTEKDLPPSMMDSKKGYEQFLELPLMKDYKENLLYVRNMSKEKVNSRLRMVYRLCLWFKKKPSALMAEDVAGLVKLIRKGDAVTKAEFKGGYDVRIASRSFFGFQGIGGTKLTSMGIGSELYEQNKTRAMARLTKEQRKRIMQEIEKRIDENWKSKDGRLSIAFKDKPEMAAAIEIYPKTGYYIGIRAASAFEKSFWEVAEERDERQHRTKFSGIIGLDSFKKGDEIIFRHLDKGKKGGIAWTKRIFGDFAEEFHAYWIRQGKPEKGLVFAGLTDYQAREFLKECYEAAGIPEYIWQGTEQNEAMPLHIWRHTAAQDLLDATEWNTDLVAGQLGWESTDILKSHYGTIPPDVQRRLVLKAQGVKVDEIPRLFIF